MMLLSAAVDEFLKALRLAQYSEHTIGSYKRTLDGLRRHAAESLGHAPEADEITRDEINAHGRTRMEKLGRRSMEHRLDTLRSFFKWLDAAHAIANPMSRVMPHRAARRLPRFLSVEEASALIECHQSRKFGPESIPARRDRAALEVLYSTGVRIAELVSLTWSDIDNPDEGYLLVRQGKGRRDRVVPLGEPAADALTAWRPIAPSKDFDAPVFQNWHGRRITVRRMERMIAERARAAGIEGRVYPHVLRHSFATHLLRAGAGIAPISEMMGHAKFSTTAQYVHVDLDHLRKALAFHPRAEMSSSPMVQLASPTVNARAAAVRPKEEPMRAMTKVTTLIAYLEKGAVQAWEKEKPDRRRQLHRFEGDRHAMLSENNSIYALDSLVTEPPTLRFLAGHCSPDEAAQLRALASRYDDLIAQLIALRTEQNAAVAKINFEGATPREVREVRAEIKEMRKLAA